MELFWLAIFGFLVASIAVIGGLGGGVFFVPILTFVIGLPISEAKDISSFVILFNSTIGAITYIKQKRVNIKVGLIASVASCLGCLTFRLFFSDISNEIIRFIFGLILVVLSFYWIIGVVKSYKEKKFKVSPNQDATLDNSVRSKIGEMPKFENNKQIIRVLPIFFAGGFLAALMGVGGGAFNVPALTMLLGFPVHFGTATSSFIIMFTKFVDVLSAAIKGTINYSVALVFCIGAVPGGFLGAKISKKIPKDVLKSILAIILMFVGFRMIFM